MQDYPSVRIAINCVLIRNNQLGTIFLCEGFRLPPYFSPPFLLGAGLVFNFSPIKRASLVTVFWIILFILFNDELSANFKLADRDDSRAL